MASRAPLPEPENLPPSMSGIFFKPSPTSDYIFNPFSAGPPPPRLRDPSPSFFSLRYPFTICSSSNGLLLCFEHCSNTYHVFNPFIHDASISYRRIPNPPRTNTYYPLAVLCVEDNQERFGIPLTFYIICPIKEGNGIYSFDWYHSIKDQWYSQKGFIDLSPTSISDNSGVSNDLGMAFWYTYDGRAVIKFDTFDHSSHRLDLQELNCPVIPFSPVIKLGKISRAKVGLVSAHEGFVVLYILEVRYWSRLGVLRFNQDELQWPGLLRFDGYVPFLIKDNRIILLEVVGDDARIHGLYPWQNVPHPFSYGTVPFISSSKIPGRPVPSDQR